MKHLLVISLLILLLAAACVPGDYYSADPDMAVIEAQANLQKATVIAARTQEAAIEATRVAELDLAQRNEAAEKELAVIEARAAERREAVNMQMTEMAVWSAAGTATAAPAATQAAYQATLPVMQVTQQALERQVRIDEAAEQRARAMVWVVPTAVVLVLMVLAWKTGAYIDEKTEALRRRNSVAETRAGTVVWDWDNYRYVLISEDALVRRLNARSDFGVIDAVEMSPGKVTATSPIGNGGNGDDRGLAIELVRTAIQKAKEGENDRVIPSWRELDWTSTRWSDAVRWLKEKKAVSTVERVGTFVNYDSLADLLYVLETEQSPTP